MDYVPPETEAVTRCQNCGEQLHGLYCHMCGASSRDGHDRTVGSFVRDAVGQVTDVEGSKFLRTLRLLLTKPGMLSAEHFTGRRVRYLKPINLFLMIFAANFIAYAAGTGVSLYDIRGFVQQSAAAKSNESPPNPLLIRLERKVASEGSASRVYDSLNERWREYASYAQIPMAVLFTLILQLFFRRRYFVENMTFSLHFFSFQVLTVLLMWPLYYLVGLKLTGAALTVTITKYGIDLIYLYLASRRFYRVSSWKAVAAAVGLMVGYYVIYLAAHTSAMIMALLNV